MDPTHLPLQHPDYRYPESRNPYSQKIEKYRGVVFSNNETETLQGRWRTALADGDSSPGRKLVVEIGCNAGHVIVEWAARDPKTAYVGLDWKFKPIFRAAEKAEKKGLKNILFFRAHADRIQHMFGPGEIDELCLYFPDPWAKKKQLKNRWLTAARLREVAPLLKMGGILHIKTDHLGYFEWMEEAVKETAELWEVLEHTRDLHAGNPRAHELKMPEVTLFERLFIADGIKINSFRLKRIR